MPMPSRSDVAATVQLVAKGACLGVANVIPGVSGGTMALVLGVYKRLIEALHNIGIETVTAIFPPYPEGLWKKWTREWARIDFFFLVWLGTGALVAILACSRLIPWLMQSHHDPTYGFFWGLIVAAVAIPWRLLQRFSWRALAALLVAAALTVGFSHQLASSNIEKAERKAALEQGSAAEPSDGRPMPSAVHLVYLVLCGALAMSAMILPGVSGSFVLLLMGVYFELFAAIHHVSAGDINGADLSVVGAVAVGSVTGLLLFSRVLEFLFRRYHDVTVAALIGLMLGSLYGIWPFRTYAVVEGDRVDGLPRVPGLDLNLLWTAVACLAGVGVIVFFCWCERRTGARADVPPAS